MFQVDFRRVVTECSTTHVCTDANCLHHEPIHQQSDSYVEDEGVQVIYLVFLAGIFLVFLLVIGRCVRIKIVEAFARRSGKGRVQEVEMQSLLGPDSEEED